MDYTHTLIFVYLDEERFDGEGIMASSLAEDQEAVRAFIEEGFIRGHLKLVRIFYGQLYIGTTRRGGEYAEQMMTLMSNRN